MTHPLAQDLDEVLECGARLWPELRGTRVFLTGGTGFVGKWLLESLLWANARLNLDVSVVVLTRRPGAFAALWPHLARDAAVGLLEGDALYFPWPEGEFPLVVHAATERAVPPTAERPVSTFDRDVAATRRVLEMARARGTQRLLFTSSGAVYGTQPPDLANVPEEYAGAPATTDLGAAYGHAKRVSELLCAGYAHSGGFTATIARLFAFVGPYLPLDGNFAVGNFLGDVLAGRPVRIQGDGTPYRSYLYAADMALWLWTILLRGVAARPYNVGSPEAVSIAELARAVVAATVPGTPIETARRPAPGAQAARYVPDTGRARSELGLVPRVGLEEAIRRTFAWHRARM